MTFYAFGLNYEKAPVESTEAFALDEAAQDALYESIDLDDESEVLFVSTCNRTEVYLYGTVADVSRIHAALSEQAGRPWPHREAFLYEDEAAVRHVLHVTSGVKSMVLGDGQILSQVKDAYRRAVDAGRVHSLMHRLMHTAFRAAKRVATETDLSSGAASVSTAAVAMARDHFARSGPADAPADAPSDAAPGATHPLGGSPVDLQPPKECPAHNPDAPAPAASTPLSDVRVLLVGAGKMGRLALQALQEYAPKAVAVTNRSPDRARQVADAHDARPVLWDDRYRAVAEADCVVVATGAPEPVLRAAHMPTSPDAGRPTLLVDISMPRNIDPVIDDLDGCRVLDLDDLNAWTEQVHAERSAEVPRAQDICEELLSDFVTWVFHQQALQPAIQAIRNTFETIREQEVDRHAHRTDMDRDEVDRLTRSIMQKLLAVPIVKLKNVDPESINFVKGIKLLHALFSRPTCEDDSAQAERQRNADHDVQLSDAPAACPFETHDPDRAPDAVDLVRDALRTTADDNGSA